MGKIRVKVLKFLVFAICITLLLPQVAFASTNDNGDYFMAESDIALNDHAEVALEAPIPNIIEVKATKVDANNIKITVFNHGIDKFDMVSCDVRIRDANGLVQYSAKLIFRDIYPLFSQSYSIYLKSWSIVEVSNIYCQDGTDTGYLLDFVLYS
jgi:hypothetical protein